MKPVCIALLAGIAACVFALPGLAAPTGTYKERVLYSFFGSYGEFPEASLIDVKGILYGTTAAGGNASDFGTAFSLDPRTGAVSVLHTFCSEQNCTDGARPEAGLVDINGKLYGTTESGGATDWGTVFSLDPATGAETVIHSFCSRGNCADGSFPLADLIAVGRELYGTTYYGGGAGCSDYGCGTVFEIDLHTGREKVLYRFGGAPDGAAPHAGLIDVNGILYGTTEAGGSAGYGTVFSVDSSTDVETVLYSFLSGTDGAAPVADLVDVGGLLYGTTSEGGNTGCSLDLGCGTVFSVNPDTGAETLIHVFADTPDGANPESGLINANGILYGTTASGGGGGKLCHFGCGTVFSIDPTTATETVLHSFCSGHRTCLRNGTFPYSGLISVHGRLYGTTQSGGGDCEQEGCGTVFELKEKRR